MTPRVFAWLFVLAILAVIGFSGYKLYEYYKVTDFSLISPDTERQLGDALYAQMSASETIVADSVVHSAIMKIIRRIDDDMIVQGNPLVLHIHNSNELNAYALPGGHIVVNSEMIRFCHSPEELAGVLAHELGHVEHRHGVNRLIQQFGLTIILAIATGSESSALQDVGMSLLNNFFSREDETQADDFALQHLVDSQIDPICMSTVFSRMSEQSGDMSGVMNFLSTHPELSKRSAGAAAYPKPDGFVALPIELDWPNIQILLTQIK